MRRVLNLVYRASMSSPLQQPFGMSLNETPMAEICVESSGIRLQHQLLEGEQKPVAALNEVSEMGGYCMV